MFVDLFFRAENTQGKTKNPDKAKIVIAGSLGLQEASFQFPRQLKFDKRKKLTAEDFA